MNKENKIDDIESKMYDYVFKLESKKDRNTTARVVEKCAQAANDLIEEEKLIAYNKALRDFELEIKKLTVGNGKLAEKIFLKLKK